VLVASLLLGIPSLLNSLVPTSASAVSVQVPLGNVSTAYLSNVYVPTTNSGSTNSLTTLVSTSAPSALPAGVVSYAPVSLSGLPAGGAYFQVMVNVESAAYSSYEAPNLSNLEFFFANGTVIPSWLESGASSSSTDTVYWLKAVGNQVTVFLGFGPKTADFMNGVTVGEAPQLSKVYGQLDNGALVFDFYDNFAGPKLNSSWKLLGTAAYSLDDGLQYEDNAFGSITTALNYSSGYAFDAYVTLGLGPDNVGFFDLTQPQGQVLYTYSGDFIREACHETYPDQWNDQGEANSCGSPYGSLYPGSGGDGVYTVDLLSPQSSLQYYNYSAGKSSQPITTNPPQLPLSAGFASKAGFDAQWARVRTAPPSGVMPSASLGQVRQSNAATSTASATTPSNTTVANSGIPEFPYQGALVALAVLAVAGSYLAVRRSRRG
jgi:hypothetical protein